MRKITTDSIIGCLCFLSVHLMGCRTMPLPQSSWRIHFADQNGHLRVLLASSQELFRDPATAHVLEQTGTISLCEGGWLDANSGRLATIEHDDAGRAIRVYDESMQLLDEYRLPSSKSDYTGTISQPILSSDGSQLAFVDGDGSLVVGKVGSKRMSVREVCKVVEASGSLPLIDCFWVTNSDLVIAYFDAIYHVDLESKDCRLLGDGKLLGVHDNNLVLSRYPIGVCLMNLEGDIRARLGRIHGQRPYSGHRIHRISPDGEYVAYDSSGRKGQSVIVIQHIRSGRKVYLTQIGSIRSLGSWSEESPGAIAQPERDHENAEE